MIVLDGKKTEVHGLHSRSYQDDAKLRLQIGRDGRPRRPKEKISLIVLHTTKGIPGGDDQRPQQILPGLGPGDDRGVRVAQFWAKSYLPGGAHFVVDWDGVVSCLADPVTEVAYHAGVVNDRSVGIEIYQGGDAELYEGQLQAVVCLVDFLCGALSVPRQLPPVYRGKPLQNLARFAGVCGHRDITANRGAGDPGDAIFVMLEKAGYPHLPA